MIAKIERLGANQAKHKTTEEKKKYLIDHVTDNMASEWTGVYQTSIDPEGNLELFGQTTSEALTLAFYDWVWSEQEGSQK